MFGCTLCLWWFSIALAAIVQETQPAMPRPEVGRSVNHLWICMLFFGFLFVFLPLPDERDGICPYWYCIILCILCCSRIVFKTPCKMKPIRTNVAEPMRSLLHLLPVHSNLEWWRVKPSKTPKQCKAFQSAWSKVFKSWNYLHGFACQVTVTAMSLADLANELPLF